METDPSAKSEGPNIIWTELPGYFQDILLRLAQGQIELSAWAQNQTGITQRAVDYLIEKGLAEKVPQKTPPLADENQHLPDYLKITPAGRKLIESIQG
jgi:DNA-binding MarR family transcriptional regulator